MSESARNPRPLDMLEALAGLGCLLWALDQVDHALAVGVLGALLFTHRLWVRRIF